MRVLIALLTLVCLSLAQADIGPRQSGAWYNPGQSGHGLTIQVLSDERTIAFWYAYTPEGHPMFLLIDGVHDHHTVTGPAYYHDGMLWGVFDPDTLNQEVWGEVSIEFLDCTRALLTWNSDLEGYGEGQVELKRLASVAELGCDDVAAEMTGEWDVTLSFPGLGSLADDGPYRVDMEADGTFEFEDDQGCRWAGHIHVQDLERGWISGEFGAPECEESVPMSLAYGAYYGDGITFCNSGGDCFTYDQGMSLMIDYSWAHASAITLQFLR